MIDMKLIKVLAKAVDSHQIDMEDAVDLVNKAARAKLNVERIEHMLVTEYQEAAKYF